MTRPRETPEKIPPDLRNLTKAFQDFHRCLVSSSGSYLQPGLRPVQIVHAFVSTFIDPEHCRALPDGRLMLPGSAGDSAIAVNYAAYSSYISRYLRNYTKDEKRQFTETADRFIEEMERRFSGDFWTPSVWVDKGVEYLEETVGKSWKEDFVVWDCCCGTKNLTRDYVFKKLYCSTLHQEELNISKDYNPEALAFQFDFLNDDIDVPPVFPPQKMPATLCQDLSARRPFLFFCNPPYATANEMGAKGKDKKGVASTMMQKLMHQEHAGKASQQLITQFLWRIMKLKEDFSLPRVVAAFYIKPVFFSPSPYYNEFRRRFFRHFSFKKGFLFNAGEFAGVNANWGITFCIFDSLRPDGFDPEKEYTWNFEVLEFDKSSGKIVAGDSNTSLGYWPEQYSLSNWIREPVKHLPPKSGRYAQMSSALRLSGAQKKPGGSLKQGALGYMVNVANNIYNSVQDVWMVSACAYKGHGVSICPENFERCLVNFASRNVAAGRYADFIHDKHEFHVPDPGPGGWSEFLADCAVYTFFASQGNQSSVVLTAADGFSYDIRNEFFPFSRAQIATISKDICNEVYKDALALTQETYMYRWLEACQKTGRLSEPAAAVLQHALALLAATMPERDPGLTEYHQERWDASWKQLKMLRSARVQEKQTRIIRAELDCRILSGVLKFGIFRP